MNDESDEPNKLYLIGERIFLEFNVFFDDFHNRIYIATFESGSWYAYSRHETTRENWILKEQIRSICKIYWRIKNYLNIRRFSDGFWGRCEEFGTGRKTKYDWLVLGLIRIQICIDTSYFISIYKTLKQLNFQNSLLNFFAI